MEGHDIGNLKEKILKFLETNGPNIPVHIAKYIGMDMIFTSAFLSELISQQKIRTSWMKIGTSPIYLLPGQENLLEKFSEHIKGKEHEALMKLKKEKFIKDSKEEPAIRVALRSLKDFAKPFESNGEIIWRYFLVEKENYEEENKKAKEKPKEDPKVKVKKIKVKKTKKKSDEKFFNRVKDYLTKRNIEIEDITNFNQKDLTLKVKMNGEKILIMAYNKKRITEKDILDSAKKAKENKLPYSILSLGEPTKKLERFVEALKTLDSFEKID